MEDMMSELSELGNSGKIWWSKMPRGTAMLKDIENITLDNVESLAIETGIALPWAQEMHEILYERLLERFSSGGIDMLEDELEEEPGEILLKKYCKPETQREYRPSKGYPYFLADVKGSTLSMRIVWIQKIKSKRLSMWCDFVKKYHMALSGKLGAAFILEAESLEGLSPAKGLHLILRNEIISPFESKLFYLMLTANLTIGDREREYLMELAWDICQENIELGAFCLSRRYWQKFIQNPQHAIEEISGHEKYSYGTLIDCHLSESKAAHRVWNSQIKHVFPRIEKYRRNFVDKYKGQLSQLQIYNSRGCYVEDVNETEIGTLYYYATNHQLSIDDRELEELQVYYNARNKLAHNDPLEWKIVQQILKTI